MDYLVTGEEMKKCDANTIEFFQIPSCVLMERAALASVEVLLTEGFDTKKVLILCGSGNNGGDGLAVARLLHGKGVKTDVCFLGKESSATQDTLQQLEICRKYHVKLISKPNFCEYTSIVDAIFGIGLSREIQGHYQDYIRLANEAAVNILALDIPSGIHANTGRVMGIAIKAAVTVTFAYCKRGLLLYQGKAHAGRVIVRDIGITDESFREQYPLAFTLTKEDIADNRLLPQRPGYSNKGTFGRVLMVAGSLHMAGAALLAAKAAYKSGSGLVRIFTDTGNRQMLNTGLPEAIVDTYEPPKALEALSSIDRWPTVIGIGPGLSQGSDKIEILTYLLSRKDVTPLVIDADALNLLARDLTLLKNHNQPLIITPHVREMARLMKVSITDVLKDLPGAAMSFAKEYQVICVLKDAGTVVSDGSRIYINQSGNSGMASGGSGDVLTGMLTGFLAQGLKPFAAACRAVYLHGLAGDYAALEANEYSILATDIIRALDHVMKPDKRK